jgi:hypothetical protein
MCRECAEQWDMQWDTTNYEERWLKPPPEWVEKEPESPNYHKTARE